MKMLKAVLLVSVIALVPTLASVTPSAAVGVAIDFGNVTMGYRDGYYDRDHRYHRWARKDAVAYRAHNQDHYRDMTHDKDRNR